MSRGVISKGASAVDAGEHRLSVPTLRTLDSIGTKSTAAASGLCSMILRKRFVWSFSFVTTSSKIVCKELVRSFAILGGAVALRDDETGRLMSCGIML
jgi:hypothetical protein